MTLLLSSPLLVLLGAGLVIWYTASTRTPDEALADHEIVQARRHSLLLGIVSVLAFVGVAAVVWVQVLLASDLNGSRALSVSPLAAAAVAVGVLLVGERTWPKPRGGRRVARLRDRRTTALARGRWLTLAVVSTVGLVAQVGWTGAIAEANGRQLVAGALDSSPSAFPGWYYGGPQLFTMALLWIGLAALFRFAVLRPATLTRDVTGDDQLRRTTIGRGLRFAAAGMLATLGGNALIIAQAYSTVAPPAPLRLVSIALLLGALTCLISPVPRLRVSGASERATDAVDHS